MPSTLALAVTVIGAPRPQEGFVVSVIWLKPKPIIRDADSDGEFVDAGCLASACSIMAVGHGAAGESGWRGSGMWFAAARS